MLARPYGQPGQAEGGLQTPVEALTLGGTTQERWWEAESYRLKGGMAAPTAEPRCLPGEAYSQQTLDVALGHQAKALELRAAVRLSRL
jgi:hypothetical protein